MDGKFEWREEFKIGVEVIDKEHQRLFRIINKLFHFREEEKDSQWISQEGIKYFKGHAVKHFEDEEAYMASIGYKGLERHRSIHRGFREHTLPALEEELERTGYSEESLDHFLCVRGLAHRPHPDGGSGHHREAGEHLGGPAAGGRADGHEKGHHPAGV